MGASVILVPERKAQSTSYLDRTLHTCIQLYTYATIAKMLLMAYIKNAR